MIDTVQILELRRKVMEEDYEPTIEETKAALAYRRETREQASRAGKAAKKKAELVPLPDDLTELWSNK